MMMSYGELWVEQLKRTQVRMLEQTEPGASCCSSMLTHVLCAGHDFGLISEYFNLDVNLQKLTEEWSARDAHYAWVNQRLQGCRMLRQDPVECLFQFICSSNNHISRIHGMVNHLCVEYGTRLDWEASAYQQKSTDLIKCGSAMRCTSLMMVLCRSNRFTRWHSNE
jgi:8-oxoguanine DNA glycosylase, N-terminal domain